MEALIFGITALIAIAGAVAMLLSKNAIHSALFLLVNFGAISVLYLLLRSPFLFAVQLIVYAGAIIVLFLFVVMLLGAERAEDDRDPLGWQRWVAVILGAALLTQALVLVIGRQSTTMPTLMDDNFAAPEKIGAELFTTYLIPFQVTGVILLAAVIGVVLLTRRDDSKG
jgi:NADH-quinone oxidoreductase subunit J